MRIKVTWKDILFGRRWDAHNCMVALALRRQTGDAKVVMGRNVCTIFGKVYQVPSHVYNKVMAFDNGFFTKLVLPFSFELPIVYWPEQAPEMKKPERAEIKALPARFIQLPAIVRAAAIN